MTHTHIVLELRDKEGGEVLDSELRLLGHQLNVTHSLDHTTLTPDNITTQFELTYIMLHRGTRPSEDLDHTGRHRYSSYFRSDFEYWIAGMCCLYFPTPRDRSIAEIVIALLPEARGKSVGRMVVQKLIEYAFDTLRVHRVIAPIVCPVRPDQSADEKKQAMFETKRLCHVFERFGFTFEGVSRGIVKRDRGVHMTRSRDGKSTSVWHDVHRMSMLDIDYFSNQLPRLLSSCTLSEAKRPDESGPWESMERRHKEERGQLKEWCPTPASGDANKSQAVEDDDEYYDDGGSDSEDSGDSN
ncbi:hypothetical protein CTheo_1474 [Ceratobasidium theobromae]|uniref:N-acetyltransferase domain-containing protein n=1 Tax=Ceratobasidium theobromae TaxID=1582974 RepID=A0A5N5QTX7_9AGAM|nr:hypothetical protein CTheo_1474 [Ceratobasidium theobromae]